MSRASWYCRSRGWLALIALTFAGADVWGQIQRIGDSAAGVSGDGSVVAGYVFVGADLQMYRWTESTGVVTLGVGTANEISRDGTTLVGERFNGSATRPVRWTAGTGIVDMGVPAGAVNVYPSDVSANGSVVVGFGFTQGSSGPTFYRGTRWTSATGTTALGDLPGGAVRSEAKGISADGQTIVGFSDGTNGTRAVRWTGTNAAPIDMGLPPGLTGFTEARAISADGSVIVGVWGTGLENEAFRWTVGGGYQLLGDLPGGLRDSVAHAANADGSVIVGVGNPSEFSPDEAVIWTAGGGMRPLREVLIASGVDMSGWQTLLTASDVSDDGRVIVGGGVLADGSFAGFRAVIPEPTNFAMVMACIAVLRRRRRLMPSTPC